MDSRLKTIALTIWLCEGTKIRRDKRWKTANSYAIEVTNTNPVIIKIFLDFLRQDLKIPTNSLRGQVQIHKGDNQQDIEKFWSKTTKIPLAQFNKTIVREVGKKPGKTKGTFKARLYNKLYFEKLQNLLEAELKFLNGE